MRNIDEKRRIDLIKYLKVLQKERYRTYVELSSPDLPVDIAERDNARIVYLEERIGIAFRSIDELFWGEAED